MNEAWRKNELMKSLLEWEAYTSITLSFGYDTAYVVIQRNGQEHTVDFIKYFSAVKATNSMADHNQAMADILYAIDRTRPFRNQGDVHELLIREVCVKTSSNGTTIDMFHYSVRCGWLITRTERGKMFKSLKLVK